MAFAPAKIHGGGSRIFSGVTAGATGTPPTYITHTAGVPGSGTELGLTQGETLFSYQLTKKEIEAEQSLGAVDVMAVGEMSQIETTVLEHTYHTLQRAFDNIGAESVAGGYGFWFGGGTGPLAPRTECVMITSVQRNAPTKYIIGVLYKAYSVEGFKLPFKKQGESVYRVVFKGLADLTRNAGDQMGYYRFEL
ncbi:MAG TPA: hypothetical protein VEA16_04805 [Vicinamibacterales bacterium]|nr:hypothetical protein [Vicinamibacterales bacterium]